MEEKTNINKRVETIKRFFTDSKPANHPIQEHPVSKQDEYVRNLYLDMLCVVAQYESSNTENAFTLLKRIMAACEETQPLQEYIKRSMEITPERTAEFIKQCKDNGLCEIFIIDAMLMACSNGSPNAKQVAFLTQFGDMLRFDKEKMTDIAKFSAKILEQDSEGYSTLLKDENVDIQKSFACYAKPFTSVRITVTSMSAHYSAMVLGDMPWLAKNESLTVANKDTVVFENLVFENQGVILDSVKNAKFKNCVFKNYTSCAAIEINTIDLLEVENCRFEDCVLEKISRAHFGLVYLNKCGTAKFESTLFKNCELRAESHGDYYLSLIYPLKMTGNGICINNCEFKGIYTHSRICKSWAKAIVYGTTHSVTNSVFFDCTSSGEGLFRGVSSQSNNQVTNCDSFTRSL